MQQHEAFACAGPKRRVFEDKSATFRAVKRSINVTSLLPATGTVRLGKLVVTAWMQEHARAAAVKPKKCSRRKGLRIVRNRSYDLITFRVVHPRSPEPGRCNVHRRLRVDPEQSADIGLIIAACGNTPARGPARIPSSLAVGVHKLRRTRKNDCLVLLRAQRDRPYKTKADDEHAGERAPKKPCPHILYLRDVLLIE